MYNDAVIMVVCHLFDLQIEKGRIRHERKRRGKQSRVQTGLYILLRPLLVVDCFVSQLSNNLSNVHDKRWTKRRLQSAIEPFFEFDKSGTCTLFTSRGTNLPFTENLNSIHTAL